MRLIHEIRDTIKSDFVVLYNPDKKRIVREYIHDGEYHFNTLNMYYDGVTGYHWIRCYIPCIYPHKLLFLAALTRYRDHNRLAVWNGKIMLIPFDNVKIYNVSPKVSSQTNKAISEWNLHCENWWREWSDGKFEMSLDDYINKDNLVEIKDSENLY